MNKLELTVEPLSTENLDDVIAIENASFPEPWSRRLFVNEIHQPESYFVVFRVGSTLIGYGGFWLVIDEAHITNLAVHPDYRRRGYGTKMLQHLLDAAVSQHATLATLEVRENNVVGQRFYQKFAFRQVAVRKNYYSSTGENAIVMINDDLQAQVRE